VGLGALALERVTLGYESYTEKNLGTVEPKWRCELYTGKTHGAESLNINRSWD